MTSEQQQQQQPAFDDVEMQLNGASNGTQDGTKDKSTAAQPQKVVSVVSLWRFATWADVLLMLVGAVCAMGTGLQQPLMTVFFGSLIDGFNPANDNFIATIAWNCLVFTILGCAAFVSASTQVAMFSLVASRQAHRIRVNYLRSIVRQEMGWFDSVQSGELTSRISG